MDKNKIKQILSNKIPQDQIFLDEPMKKHTSFKIGGPADIFLKVRNIEELKYAISVSKKENLELNIIGNGSNILVKDKGIRGITLKIEFEEIHIQDNIVTVGAGVRLGLLAQKLLKEELSGFEFACGIPGTIGGAVTMNAGAYGKEMKDIIVKTRCLDVENSDKIIILDNNSHHFSYRHSVFMEKKYIILDTTIQLTKGDYEKIKADMDELLASRREKQPVDIPNAGSTFKRGKDYITAKIIDECGLKGYKIGGAMVSEKHAGFIVNSNNATAKDVIDLVEHIKKIVYEKMGYNIELEIKILGE